jgi:hypothetical protein
MVNVSLPRGSWETLLYMIAVSDSPIRWGMYKEIEDQVYSQEY